MMLGGNGKAGLLNGFEIKKPTSFRTESYNYDDNGNISDYSKKVGFDPNDKDVNVTMNVPSTAIANARYDPSDDSMNITYVNGNKEYKFKAGGQEGLEEWVNAPSKGRITNEWRQSTLHRYPGY